MKRKIIVILLVLILIFNAFSFSYAGPVAVALTAKEIVALGGLLVAGGLVYSNQEDIKRSATDAYYNFMDSDIRQNFRDSVMGAVDGVATFGINVWESVKGYVGNNTGVLQDYIVTQNITSNVSYNNIDVFGNILGFGVTCDFGAYKEYKLLSNGKYLSRYEYFVEDLVYNGYKYNIRTRGTVEFYAVSPPWFETFINGDNTLILQINYIDKNGEEDYITSCFEVRKLCISTGDQISSDRGIMMDIPVSQNYDATSVIDSVGWKSLDQKVHDEEKVEIFLPPGLDDLVDRNFHNPTTGDYTGDVPIESPVPGVDTGTGNLAETNAKIDTIITNMNNNYNTDPSFDPNMIRGKIEEKLNVNVLKNALERLQNINTEKGEAPVIKINLHRYIDAGIGRIDPSAKKHNSIADEEMTLIDFGILESYQFGGYSVIDYFRKLIAAGFIWHTLLYIWNKIIPSKAVT